MDNTDEIDMKDGRDILEIENLKVCFHSDKRDTVAVEDLSLSLQEGSILGLVGESGSGKSVTSLEILGLNGKSRTSGSILFKKKDGTIVDMLKAGRKEKEAIRGSEIAMIFQEPGSALNPVLTIGKQLERVIRLHERTLGKKEIREKAIKLLGTAGLREIEKIYLMYPHELSGGMKQRAVIAMALSSNPKLLLADEPTTALDRTTEKEILSLLGRLVKENNLSMILISHDLGVIEKLSDFIAIMRKGKLYEVGTKKEILENAVHPYTRRLLEISRNKEDLVSKEDKTGMDSTKWGDYRSISGTHRVLLQEEIDG